MRFEIVKDCSRYLLNASLQVIKLSFTPGHNTEEIGLVGEVNYAAIMKLMLAGFGVASFTKFMGNGIILGNRGA
jgi:hypothetical protein